MPFSDNYDYYDDGVAEVELKKLRSSQGHSPIIVVIKRIQEDNRRRRGSVAKQYPHKFAFSPLAISGNGRILTWPSLCLHPTNQQGVIYELSYQSR